MRWLLSWLLMLGMLAGQTSRLAVMDPEGAVQVALMFTHTHDHGHHDHPEHPCSPEHDQNCPLEHHHHCAGCIHTMPMASDDRATAGFACLNATRVPYLRESVRLPDPPFDRLDKPPLI